MCLTDSYVYGFSRGSQMPPVQLADWGWVRRPDVVRAREGGRRQKTQDWEVPQGLPRRQRAKVIKRLRRDPLPQLNKLERFVTESFLQASQIFLSKTWGLYYKKLRIRNLRTPFKQECFCQSQSH